MALIDAYDGFFFDLDGVLYLSSTPIPGAPETLHTLAKHNKQIAVLTNNSSLSVGSVTARLESLGFDTEHILVIVATTTTASWLAGQKPEGTAYVLGAQELKQEIARAGLKVVTDPESVGYACDFLVVGNDRQIGYRELTEAVRVGRNGALFIAVNEDRIFPTDSGLAPGAASIVQAVASGAERQPDVRIGKPSTYLIDEALRKTGLEPKQCLMVGDTLQIDVSMGNSAGLDTALVLTGVDSRATLARSEVKPTYVLDSVADLVRD